MSLEQQLTIVTSVPSASALANLLSGMATNAWADFAAGALDHTLTNPLFNAGEDPVVDNSSSCSWDSTRQRMVFTGGGHGNVYQEKVLTFVDAVNAWNNTDPPPIPGSQGVDSGVHQFASQTANLTTGDIFINVQTGPFYGFYYRLGGTTTWINDNTGKGLLGVHAQRDCSCFNPAAGTGGTVIHGSQYGITRFDYKAASNKWALLNTSGLLIDNAPVGFYDPISQCTYVCGGGSLFSVKVTKTGVCTQAHNLPDRASVPTPTDICAVIVDGYTTPAGVVRKPLLVRPGGNMWEFDGVADSWAIIGTAPLNAFAGQNTHFIGAVPTYDAVMWVQKTNALGDCLVKICRRY